jgi:hypothetical protein
MDGEMTRWSKAALIAAGLVAAMGAARADDARLPVGLTSFGAARALAAYPLSGLATSASFSQGDFFSNPLQRGAIGRDSFAASLALSSKLALDSGYNIDLSQRFGNFDTMQSPLLSGANFLGLANGGAYAGVTWMPAPSLGVRIGAAEKNDRLDRFSFDPIAARLGLPLAFDAGQSRALIAGLNWDISDWAGLGLTAVQNSQDGIPYDINPTGSLVQSSRVDTGALDVSARFKLGSGWVTTASYAQGLTQLDQRDAPAEDSRSYSIAIAKHGVFGNDAVGFSLSRPAPGILENGFDMVAASGDLPPVFVASGRIPDQTPETDLQLGYVTTMLDGALALQANASYQMNYQGQTGATSLSVLSRAKIKF